MAVAQAVVIAALSAWISYLVARRQKNLEFTYDYRKYILDKRKVAYNKIEALMNEFQTIHLDDGRIIQKFYELPEGNSAIKDNPLALFNAAVVDVIRNAMWMNTKMVLLIELLNYNILTQLKELKVRGLTESALLGIGTREYKFIRSVHDVMFELYLEDLMHLDEIDKFRKEKNSETDSRIKATREHIQTQIEKRMSQHII